MILARIVGTVVAIEDGLCTVRTDSNDVLAATAVNVGAVGTRTSVSLRPESVRFQPSQARTADNKAAGSAEERLT